MKETRVPVRLGHRRYEVRIGVDHLASLGPWLRRLRLGTDLIVVTNSTVLKKQGSRLRRALAGSGMSIRFLAVPDSERSKSFEELGRLLTQLARWDGPGKRLALLLAGGGVVGDLGGLAAGLYRRGIPCLQLPTTLLAQVDSAIGGKTAIDLPEGKNLVGLILQPRGVFIEVGWLRTLPERQFRSGLAEMLKCGVIRDARLFEELERASVRDLRRDEPRLARLVARAVRVKAAIVEADERETRGLRTLLNLGHTFGHALEAATSYSGAVTHGEAVAAGMLVATGISRRLGLISDAPARRIRGAIERLGFRTRVRGVRPAAVRRAMSQDKKWAAGKNRWVLPVGIGRCVVRSGVGEGTVRAAIASVLEG